MSLYPIPMYAFCLWHSCLVQPSLCVRMQCGMHETRISDFMMWKTVSKMYSFNLEWYLLCISYWSSNSFVFVQLYLFDGHFGRHLTVQYDIQLTCYCIYTLSIVPLLQACLVSLQGSWQLNYVPIFVSSVRTNLCHVIACSICSYWVVSSPYQKFHHVNDVAEGHTPATHGHHWNVVLCQLYYSPGGRGSGRDG